MSPRKSKTLVRPQGVEFSQHPSNLQVQIRGSHFSGPLPRPDILAAYENTLPGAADRVISMAERQSAHREALEAKHLDAGIRAQQLGSVFAFILSLIVVLGGFLLLWQGKKVEGLGSLITAAAVLVGNFIYSKRQQRDEREEKSAALAERTSQEEP